MQDIARHLKFEVLIYYLFFQFLGMFYILFTIFMCRFFFSIFNYFRCRNRLKTFWKCIYLGSWDFLWDRLNLNENSRLFKRFNSAQINFYMLHINICEHGNNVNKVISRVGTMASCYRRSCRNISRKQASEEIQKLSLLYWNVKP